MKYLNIALVGEPNAGKSSLLNQIIQQDIAIVTPKVQTTRVKLRGVFNDGDTQLVFIDTPGLFEARGKLEKAIVSNAKSAFEEADVICVLFDPKRINDYVAGILAQELACKKPTYAIINKIDTLPKPQTLILAEQLSKMEFFDEIFFLSAKNGKGVRHFLNFLENKAKDGAWMYQEDDITDSPSRNIAEEITREQAYLQLNKELPYSLKVETDTWREDEEGITEIHQSIYVLKESQKTIFLGAGGSKIKEIGRRARLKIAKVLGLKLRLFLHVKVREDWIDKDFRNF